MITMASSIKHLIFDMGGVLVRIRWHQQVSRILQRDVPFEEIHALWGQSRSTHEFETGQLDFDGFTDAFLTEFQPPVSRSEFQQLFRDIVDDDFPGAVELLDELRGHYTLSLLSNTNPCHWDIVRERNTFLPLLHHHFTSLDLGVMKPDPAIYQAVLNRLNAMPEETLFFDDGVKNVAAARELGMEAEEVNGPEDIRRILKEKRLLPKNR